MVVAEIVGVVYELPVFVPGAAVVPAVLVNHLAVKPVVQPAAVKVTEPEPHTAAPVPVGLGALQGTTQLVGAFTVIVSVQPADEVTTSLTGVVVSGILATLSAVTVKLGKVVTVPPVAVNLMV